MNMLPLLIRLNVAVYLRYMQDTRKTQQALASLQVRKFRALQALTEAAMNRLPLLIRAQGTKHHNTNLVYPYIIK